MICGLFPTGSDGLGTGAGPWTSSWPNEKQNSQVNAPGSALRGNLPRLIQEVVSRDGNWKLILQNLKFQEVQDFVA